MEELIILLRVRIQGLPDHPWIPGIEFADGKIMKALEKAENELWKMHPKPVDLFAIFDEMNQDLS